MRLEKPQTPDQPLSFRDKIRLDRYAIKGNRNDIEPGDWVVVLTVEDPKFPVKEIGIVSEVNGNLAKVKIISGSDYGTEFEQYIGKMDKLLEYSWEHICARVSEGVSSVESEDKRQAVEKDFFDETVNRHIIPAGRINTGAGTNEYKLSIGATPEELTLFNCFGGETIVQTKEGPKPINTLSGQVTVLSMGGVWREAEFKSYGEQELFEVTLKNGESFRATAGHEWFVRDNNGRIRKVTTTALEGHRIPVVPAPHPEKNGDYYEGLRHGIVYGDGTLQSNDSSKSCVLLFGEKKEFASYFGGYPQKEHFEGDYIRVSHLPAEYKKLPSDDLSPSYWYGFIVGLMGTDGYCDARGSAGINQSDSSVFRAIIKNLNKTGFVSNGVDIIREWSPFDGSYAPSFRLSFVKSSLTAEDFIKPSHKEKFIKSPKARNASLEVVKVKPLGIIEEVYCCDEPETHSFVIGSGVLTGNCYVIPHGKDSRQGHIESLGIQVEVHSRGGGVGQDWSYARPRTAPVVGVRGRSSGAVSWGGGKSYYTGLIEQGGSRRGATMGMLRDWHPDLVEFVTSKLSKTPRKLPDGSYGAPIDYIRNKWLPKFPGSTIYAHGIENANLSVLISDAFMEAVRNDDEWHLEFPDTSYPNFTELWTDVYHCDLPMWKMAGLPVVRYHTYRARDLRDLMLECMWMSAEPGWVFIDRYRAYSNSNYYRRGIVIATNPCGEQGLPAWGVCNLSAINLARFVKGNTGNWMQDVDWEGLVRTVHRGVRFLDNVIDHTPYHFEENEIQQKGERRIGLGIMGYAEMLIRLGLRYGSEEALEFTNYLGMVMAVEGYKQSVELAKEKGPFPWFEADGFLSSDHMQKNILPAAPWLEDEIRKYGIRNVTIFTIAPTGSTGTMEGTSTGCEPYFAFTYWRNSRLGMAEIVEDVAAEWLVQNGYEPTKENLKHLPDHFVSAMELTPEEHIAAQAAWQKWICSSISKTCNAPNSHTVEDIANIIELAYEKGLKGFTYYRDGSRDEQVLATSAEGLFSKEEKAEEAPVVTDGGPTTEELMLMESGCVNGVCSIDK